MSPAVLSRPADSVNADELYRLTVEQYHRMGDIGVLDDDTPVELLEGLLFERQAVSRPAPPGQINLDELFPLTVEQYEAMGRAGILTTDDRVELIEGILVRKMTVNPPHSGTIRRCRTRIEPTLPTGWRYRSEQPVVLLGSEPEPDGLIARGTPEDDDRYHPPAAETALVIEVADSTLARDRTFKLRQYARAAIPIYWIVNLIDRQIEVYTDPDAAAVPHPTYRRRDVFTAGMTLAVPIANATLAVADLLPPA